MNETTASPPSSFDWQAWLAQTAQVGLTRKWDAEYLLPYQTASQVPAPSATPSTGIIQPGFVSPWMLAAGAAVALGVAYLALRD